MEISQVLDELRTKFPACHSIAYADITTSMILGISARKPVPQERWDGMCDTAVEMLSGDAAARICQVLSGTTATDIQYVIIVEGFEFGLFIKSETNPADAFCCLFAHSLPLDAFIVMAQEHLALIEQVA